MFALFKKKNPYEQAARLIYASCLERVRDERFYTDYGVPDTIDGRFDLLLLHEFLVINRLLDAEAGGLSQALFDVTFADMDQMLREMGVGDMGLPKRMRRMMKSFNGRMHVYADALHDDEALRGALARNLYATAAEDVSPQALEKMVLYVRDGAACLAGQEQGDLLAGRAAFEE